MTIIVLVFAVGKPYTNEELASVFIAMFASYVVEGLSLIMLVGRYREWKRQQLLSANASRISTVQYTLPRELIDMKMFMVPPPYSALPPDIPPPPPPTEWM